MEWPSSGARRSSSVEENVGVGSLDPIFRDGLAVIVVTGVPLLRHPISVPIPHESRVMTVSDDPHVVRDGEEVEDSWDRSTTLQPPS